MNGITFEKGVFYNRMEHSNLKWNGMLQHSRMELLQLSVLFKLVIDFSNPEQLESNYSPECSNILQWNVQILNGRRESRIEFHSKMFCLIQAPPSTELYRYCSPSIIIMCLPTNQHERSQPISTGLLKSVEVPTYRRSSTILFLFSYPFAH